MEDNCHRLCEGSSSRAFRRRCRSTPVPRRGPAPAQRLGRAGEGEKAPAWALRAYDQIIGLDRGDVAVEGCMTKAPCGGPLAGPSTVDRRKGGLKRSVATEAAGVPLGVAAASANRHDSPLLAPTLGAAISQLGGLLPEQPTCHLDAAYQGTPTCQTWPSWACRPDRPPGHPRPHPGPPTLAPRTHPPLDERPRQTP